ncbi:MAG: DUF2497 domain-containing protein [Rhodospirillaceae bacterium]
MSDTNADQQEPSMEEILASIRRIISEDGEEESEGEAVAANPDADDTPVEAVNDDNEAPEDDAEDDILELTDVIEDGEPEPDPETEPDPDPEPDPEPEPEPEPALEIELVDDDKLVSDEVEEVSAAAMSGLTAALAANAAIGDGNQTLEQLVKDVLRPILKEWLDENLPDIVDRIVREEVERIAARAK